MRLIDADELYARLMNRYLMHNMKDDRLDMAARAAIGSCMEAVDRSKTITITPPPNDPLTISQLRKMDGEPVWISPAKENGKVPARWMLVSGYNQNKDIYLFAPSCNITQGYDGKSYGKTWLAYRRRPEEGTE